MTQTRPESHLQTLKQMQALCDQIIDQTEALDAMRELVEALNRNLQTLGTFYEQDWLALVEGQTLAEEDVAALNATLAAGRYSILDQDTIWNALQDAHSAQLALAKLLVKDLRG